jgi:hypothetical protein
MYGAAQTAWIIRAILQVEFGVPISVVRLPRFSLPLRQWALHGLTLGPLAQ